MLMITTKGLTKSFGKNQVVKGIDLTVEKGEIFGFLGRNGAGKSTFINMLTGIVIPTSGSYSLLGEEENHNAIKHKIGVMPDYSTFYQSMTALKHLQFLAGVSGKKVSKETCMSVLAAVGLEGHEHKKTSKFSFGMKKKLGVAQAIIHDPELIFLDEPTSGMDAESVLQIQHLIRSLQKQGKTIFMTSHNLDEVEKICNRLAIMKEGRIIKSGTMEELRAFYRSNIEVKVKHSPIPVRDQEDLEQWLSINGRDLEMEETHFHIVVEDEKKIADIIRVLNRIKVDVYRVEVDEPTLEEIFLEREEAK
ncbi:ABC transporter ATP-binding protein [Rossellomorea marisflavi]|uniref:ABC transporter ATP-binding protein n=1 Tax=Rossellomorea marisflavi TaxID=189381 RepID=UPI003D2E581F